MSILAPSHPSLPRSIAIVGPTASGKSALALRLSAVFNGEIIAADSRTLYRGMDIGTAKPLRDGQRKTLDCGCSFSSEGVVHHLIDRLDPSEMSSVALFKSMAEACLAECVRCGKLPIIVGGTGQYVDSLLHPIALATAAPDQKIRGFIEQLSPKQQVAELARRDPITAASIDIANARRVARALEIVLATGKPRQPLQPTKPVVESIIFGLSVRTPLLWERIEERIDDQIRCGLKDEVVGLARHYGWNAPGLKAIGYHEWQSYHAGESTLGETRARLIYDTRHYAKRQLTWFKRDQNIRWFSTDEEYFLEAQQLVKSFLEK